MKHTKGVWQITPNNNWNNKKCFDIIAEDDDGFEFLCDVINEGDANLICAAPDLLKALEGMIHIVKGHTSNLKYDGYYEMAKHVINRAKGVT